MSSSNNNDNLAERKSIEERLQNLNKTLEILQRLRGGSRIETVKNSIKVFEEQLALLDGSDQVTPEGSDQVTLDGSLNKRQRIESLPPNQLQIDVTIPSDELVNIDQRIKYKKERLDKLSALRNSDKNKIEILNEEISGLEDERNEIMKKDQATSDELTSINDQTSVVLNNAIDMVNELLSHINSNRTEGVSSSPPSSQDQSFISSSSEETSYNAPQAAPQAAPQVAPQAAPQAAPQDAPQDAPQVNTSEESVPENTVLEEPEIVNQYVENVQPSQESEPVLQNNDKRRYELLAKLFSFYLNPEFRNLNIRNLNINSCKDYIRDIVRNINFNNPIINEETEKQNILNKYNDILAEKPNTIDYILYEYINTTVGLNNEERLKHLDPINEIILIIKYLNTIKYADSEDYKNNFKNVYSILINKINDGIKYSIFVNYLYTIQFIEGIHPKFYQLDIRQTNNDQANSDTEIKNITTIDCTITLTTLSMIIWVMSEIYHDFGENKEPSKIFTSYIRTFIKNNTDSTKGSNQILLKLIEEDTLNRKKTGIITPELATEMMTLLCNHYKIPFLNLSQSRNKVLYDMHLNDSEHNWSSHLPDFLINSNTYVYNTSDINDHSKTQFANLDNLRLIDNHPVTDLDAAHQPAHRERDGTNNRIKFNDYTYYFTLNYQSDYKRKDQMSDDLTTIINLLRFYISSTSRSEDSRQPYRLILNSIGKNGGNLSVRWDNSLKMRNINVNVVEKVLKDYSERSMEKYMTSLATAKLCGDIQYFISSLICAANINDNDNNNIFMDSSKDYSAIFNVLSLEYCKYTIDGHIIDLNDKNIIGNLVSIRDRGTNFVPKSERMINIITLMYLCIENPDIGDLPNINIINSLVTIFRCIKETMFNIIKNDMSNLDYNRNENTLLIPMGIHTPSWNRLNDLFNPDNFPNYCFPKEIGNIKNIKEFLSNNKRKVYNFEYTSMDYWIAEKIYDHIISQPPPSSSGNGNGIIAMDLGGSKKNKTIKHKRNRKNKTNRNKRNRRNRRNKTIRKKRKRKNKTIKYI
jgi:hypothetical protein